MKLSKFLLVISMVTCVSLLYVYQQTEIFRFAYLGEKKQLRFDELLDKNKVLRYNIMKRASLVEIGDKISEDSDFQMPESYRLVKFFSPKDSLKLAKETMNKETALSRFFSVKRQAQAETVNP
jgi:hypothetical protein